MKINIIKVYYKKKGKRNNARPKQSYFLSNIKMSFQFRIFSKPRHCQIKNLQIQNYKKIMLSGVEVLRTSFCDICNGRSRQRSLSKWTRNWKWHIALVGTWLLIRVRSSGHDGNRPKWRFGVPGFCGNFFLISPCVTFS